MVINANPKKKSSADKLQNHSQVYRMNLHGCVRTCAKLPAKRRTIHKNVMQAIGLTWLTIHFKSTIFILNAMETCS